MRLEEGQEWNGNKINDQIGCNGRNRRAEMRIQLEFSYRGQCARCSATFVFVFLASLSLLFSSQHFSFLSLLVVYVGGYTDSE